MNVINDQLTGELSLEKVKGFLDALFDEQEVKSKIKWCGTFPITMGLSVLLRIG